MIFDATENQRRLVWLFGFERKRKPRHEVLVAEFVRACVTWMESDDVGLARNAGKNL
jgi:hypothetical protein